MRTLGGTVVFISLVGLVAADLFKRDGILISAPKKANVVEVEWHAVVTVHFPTPPPVSNWTKVIQGCIAVSRRWIPPHDQRIWEKRLSLLHWTDAVQRNGRTKRGLFNFVAELSRSIFGTATEKEVNRVKHIVASVAHRLEHIIHTVTELWTAVNDSRRYEQENREDLRSLANHTQQIDIALARVVERLGLLHNLGDGCRGQNRGRDGRGTATGGPR